jgi:adenylate kinase family enzyme
MRIGIAGCSGTGKSILAENLAIELDIPFLPSKQITSEILHRDGYDYASGQQVEKFLGTQVRQRQILKKAYEQQSVDSFVTDRTAIDLASYAILEMDRTSNIRKYVERCREFSVRYDYVFFCPWEDKEAEDNKKRTLDPWYQFSVHSIQIEIAKMFPLSCFHQLESSSADERLKEILKYIS